LSVSVAVIEDDGGAGFGERALDRRIGLLGERGLHRGQDRSFPRFEHRLGRREPFCWIGRQQVQAAERSLDRASQPVIQSHRLEVIFIHPDRRVSGCRFEQPVLIFDEHLRARRVE
jgi:hypothetical protein